MFWSKLFFLLFKIKVKALSLLPLPVLYIFSDACYYLVYYIVRYRRKVVFNNIQNAFPDYTERQVRETEKLFYRHLCDVVVEIIKLCSISKEKLAKRVSYRNMDVLNALRKQGKSFFAITGHYGNWEWINAAFPDDAGYRVMSVYRPLRNMLFDKFMYATRSRFGTLPVPMRNIYRQMLVSEKNKELTAVGFVSDQCPSWEEINYWVEFLSQDTPVYTGQERLAKKTGVAVVFFAMRKIRRGYYEVEVVPITDDASLTPEHWITDRHVAMLEELIKESPQYWLWSHRRWKRTREAWLEKMKKKRK